jgi:hypothetical protein
MASTCKIRYERGRWPAQTFAELLYFISFASRSRAVTPFPPKPQEPQKRKITARDLLSEADDTSQMEGNTWEHPLCTVSRLELATHQTGFVSIICSYTEPFMHFSEIKQHTSMQYGHKILHKVTTAPDICRDYTTSLPLLWMIRVVRGQCCVEGMVRKIRCYVRDGRSLPV